MKLLVITDVHRRTQVLKWVIELCKDFDLLVIAGDVAEWGDERLFRYFYKSLSDKNIKTLFVPGNHDPILELSLDKILNLHGRSINFNGLIFCGLGGSNPTPFNTLFELDDDQAYELLSRLPNQIDVLISHASPHGTKCDRSYRGNHIGSNPIRSFIEKAKPRVVISGHVHEARSVDVLGDTWMVNPGPAMNGFYATISINGGPRADLFQI